MKKKNSRYQAETLSVGDLYVFNLKAMVPTEADLRRPRLGRPKSAVPIPPAPKKNTRKKKP